MRKAWVRDRLSAKKREVKEAVGKNSVGIFKGQMRRNDGRWDGR
jgi:hypothetical protein